MAGPALRVCVLIALLALLGGCDRMELRRGNEAEPPPKGWEALGMNPAYTLRTVPTVSDADRLCRALGVAAHDEYSPRQIEACVVPSTHELILPANAPQATRVHEFTHTWGQVHHNGKHWFGPDGKPTPPLTAQQAQMILAMANGQQQAQQPARGLLALGQSQLATDAGR